MFKLYYSGGAWRYKPVFCLSVVHYRSDFAFWADYPGLRLTLKL